MKQAVTQHEAHLDTLDVSWAGSNFDDGSVPQDPVH